MTKVCRERDAKRFHYIYIGKNTLLKDIVEFNSTVGLYNIKCHTDANMSSSCKEKQEDTTYLSFTLKINNTVIPIGSYVVFIPKSEFKILTYTEFHNMYEEVDK